MAACATYCMKRYRRINLQLLVPLYYVVDEIEGKVRRKNKQFPSINICQIKT
jgi:hypothetical protein